MKIVHSDAQFQRLTSCNCFAYVWNMLSILHCIMDLLLGLVPAIFKFQICILGLPADCKNPISTLKSGYRNIGFICVFIKTFCLTAVRLLRLYFSVFHIVFHNGANCFFRVSRIFLYNISWKYTDTFSYLFLWIVWISTVRASIFCKQKYMSEGKT